MQTFTAGVRDNELQQVLRMARHQNSADALVHALQFEAAKSASGWTSHKVRSLKERDGTDDETRRSAPQNKICLLYTSQVTFPCQAKLFKVPYRPTEKDV